MKKIVYLFGAGASCACLPIVKEIPDRLEKLIELLSRDEFALSDSEVYDKIAANKSKRTWQHEMINDLRKLLELCKKHASIDTAAKKLYIKGNNKELDKLKLGLSVFLICEQLLNPPDPRYDTFYASILGSSKHSFPKNIRIVSWNYDFQFEISYMEYSEDVRIDGARGALGTMSKFEDGDNNKDIQSFGLFKLNGSPTLFRQQFPYRGEDLITEYNGQLGMDQIAKLVQGYVHGLYAKGAYKPGISFAWESHRTTVNVVDTVINNIADAEVMIVVGYSFPFFNREVDREIIQKMTSLNKVYFQSPEADNLIERFHAITEKAADMTLVPIRDVSQFYLPNEL